MIQRLINGVPARVSSREVMISLKQLKKQVIRVLTYLEQCFEAAESQWQERCEEMSRVFFSKIEGGASDQCSIQLQNYPQRFRWSINMKCEKKISLTFSREIKMLVKILVSGMKTTQWQAPPLEFPHSNTYQPGVVLWVRELFKNMQALVIKCTNVIFHI